MTERLSVRVDIQITIPEIVNRRTRLEISKNW